MSLTEILLLGLVAAVGLLSSIPLYADAAQNRLLQARSLLTRSGYRSDCNPKKNSVKL